MRSHALRTSTTSSTTSSWIAAPLALAAAAILAALLLIAPPGYARAQTGAHSTQAGGVSPPDEGSPGGGPPESAPPEPAEPRGGPTAGGGASPNASPDPPGAPVGQAQLAPDGRTAIAPVDAPVAVQRAIAWANRITAKPYRYGGGHRRFNDRGYDCSGAVSYALRGAGLLARPRHSSALMSWGAPGPGQWITVYTHPGHAFVTIAGLRFDTSGSGGRGPRWRSEARSTGAYRVRHVPGL